ncbi:MAG: FtsX-like permease family protein [Deltaproteobacteria bacterium]|nr:FtsX-like permease family protein [Deltaproteobacteria bacterium]
MRNGGILRRKLWREYRRQKGQVIAVGLLVTLGVALFVASLSGYLDLSASYEATQRRLALADLHVDASVVTPADVERARGLPGVAHAEARWVASLPLEVPSRHDGVEATCRLEARFLSLPDAGEPALDRLYFLAGGMPEGPGEVVVEKHLADYHRLRPGDELRLRGDATGPALRVAGVAVAAEYLWVAKNRQEIMVSPRDFGVVWARRHELQRLSGAALAAWRASSPWGAPAGAAAAPVLEADAGNQLLVALAPGADGERVAEALRGTLGAAFVQATPRENLPGVELLRLDLEGLQGTAYFFPVFFLVVAAFVVAALLGRMVDAQRRVIGTMLALGASRRRVLRHYLGFSLLLGLAASGLGAGLGAAGGGAMAEAYAQELNIPFVWAEYHPWIVLAGLAMGLLATGLAGWLPARRAARLEPAEAMRRAPWRGRHPRRSGALVGRLPFPLRVALRDVLRRPGRSLATAFGVAAALVLLLTTALLVDSAERAMDSALESQPYDFRADLYVPRTSGELLAVARELEGVTDAEVGLTLPVLLTGPGGVYQTYVQGVPDEPRLMVPVDFDGRAVVPGPGEVVVPREVAKRLGVAPGGELELRLLPFGPAYAARVGGLSDSIAGATAAARLGDLQRRLERPDAANTLLVRARPEARAAARARLQALPALAAFLDVDALREVIADLAGLVVAFVGVMLLLAVVLAASVLFNTATLGILERRRELATRRALGQSQRSIALSLTLEHGLLALLGLALGLPLGLLAGWGTLSFYTSDLMSLPFAVSARTVAVAVVGVLLVLLVAQWPALRAVSRTSIAEAVRGDDD